MRKLKATQSGKAGKHKGQDSFKFAYARGLRKARVVTAADLRLLDRIVSGSADEQTSALRCCQRGGVEFDHSAE